MIFVMSHSIIVVNGQLLMHKKRNVYPLENRNSNCMVLCPQNIPLFSAWFEVIFEGLNALTVELPLSGFVSPSPPQGECSQTCP